MMAKTFNAAHRNPEIPGYYIEAQFEPWTVYGAAQEYMVQLKVWRDRSEDVGYHSTDWLGQMLVPATAKGQIDLQALKEDLAEW
jgi:hypothetical protein